MPTSHLTRKPGQDGLKGLGKKDLSQPCLSFDPATALLRAVNMLDMPPPRSALYPGRNPAQSWDKSFFPRPLGHFFGPIVFLHVPFRRIYQGMPFKPIGLKESTHFIKLAFYTVEGRGHGKIFG
jgi:hypothetical protein